ncbi:MAG: tripartite tricarboxylate transporter substrate binding protein, partial [Geminicoccaceae bacterium]
MRVIQSVALATALVLGALGTAVAEAPTIIVNYKEGGAADRTARGIAESMSRAIDDQVRVENVAGQGGAKGILEFLETGQDGGTLLFAFAPATTSVSIKHPEFQLDSLR